MSAKHIYLWNWIDLVYPFKMLRWWAAVPVFILGCPMLLLYIVTERLAHVVIKICLKPKSK